jgi:hypothetical protein
MSIMILNIRSLTQLLVICLIVMIANVDRIAISAFTPYRSLYNGCLPIHVTTSVSRSVASATMAESGIPAASSEPDSDVSDVTIPTNLPSECGMDYVPLASMLATGQLAEADQVRQCFELI